MILRCMLCGRKEEINKEHIDFRKFQENPKAVYICTLCSARAFHEAKESQKPGKPM